MPLFDPEAVATTVESAAADGRNEVNQCREMSDDPRDATTPQGPPVIAPRLAPHAPFTALSPTLGERYTQGHNV